MFLYFNLIKLIKMFRYKIYFLIKTICLFLIIFFALFNCSRLDIERNLNDFNILTLINSASRIAPFSLNYLTNERDLIPVVKFVTSINENVLLFPSVTPISANGLAYSIDPSLPDGILLDKSTGVISGLSLEDSSNLYVITTSNQEGVTSSELTFIVSSSPVSINYPQNVYPLLISNQTVINQPVLTPSIDLLENIVFSIDDALSDQFIINELTGEITATNITNTNVLNQPTSILVTVANPRGSTNTTIRVIPVSMFPRDVVYDNTSYSLLLVHLFLFFHLG